MLITILSVLKSQLLKLASHIFRNPILYALLIMSLVSLLDVCNKLDKSESELNSLNKSFNSLKTSYDTFKKLLEDEKVRSELEVERINSTHNVNILKLRGEYYDKIKDINTAHASNIIKLNSMHQKGNLNPDQVSEVTIGTFLDYSNSQNELLRSSNELLTDTARAADHHAAEVIKIKGECIWQETLDELKDQVNHSENKNEM